MSRANGKWFKSRFSSNNGACVEVRELADGVREVRHSKDPNGPVLAYTQQEWDAFVKGVKIGEFD